MQNLPRSVFTDLVAEAEGIETQLSQLLRDYRREDLLQVIFAVDFSEVFEYLHFTEPEAVRAAINIHILETIRDPLTILPCSVGELLNDLFKNMPDTPKGESAKRLLATYPNVKQFVEEFPAALKDEDRLVSLYSSAASNLRLALGPLLDLLVTKAAPAPIQKMSSLLTTKIHPIEEITRVRPLSKAEKRLSTAVRRNLDRLRPGLTDNNEADALDAIIAYVLNVRQGALPGSYLAIYTHSTDVINACNAVRGLRWENDFLVRGTKYLQYRTKLQERFSSIPERIRHVTTMIELCQNVRREAPNLTKALGMCLRGQPGVSPELMELYRRYDTEARIFLQFAPPGADADEQKKRAVALYQVLQNVGRFDGRLEEAFDVLKEHLRQLFDDLQGLTPLNTRQDELSSYRERMRKWLGIPPRKPRSPRQQTPGKGERDDDTAAA